MKDQNIDFETSIKFGGSRFVAKDRYGNAERMTIWLDTHVNLFKYTEISPLIVNEDVMFGTGQLKFIKINLK